MTLASRQSNYSKDGALINSCMDIKAINIACKWYGIEEEERLNTWDLLTEFHEVICNG